MKTLNILTSYYAALIIVIAQIITNGKNEAPNIIHWVPIEAKNKVSNLF